MLHSKSLCLPLVVIMCMHSVLIGADTQYALLTTALDMRMVDRGYIFIPYDTLHYALPYKDVSYPALANDSKLRQAYDAVLTVTMDSGDRNFYEAFRDAQESAEIRSSLAPQEVKRRSLLWSSVSQQRWHDECVSDSSSHAITR